MNNPYILEVLNILANPIPIGPFDYLLKICNLLKDIDLKQQPAILKDIYGFAQRGVYETKESTLQRICYNTIIKSLRHAGYPAVEYDMYDGPIYHGAKAFDDDPSVTDRQDHVDNSIYSMLLELTGRDSEELPWDIETIHEILDSIREILWQGHRIRIPYPSYEEEDEE